MFFIPAQLISIATFPGIIVHEAAHLLFCRLRKVAVLDACYFQFGNPAGYVIHENTGNFYTTFLVSMGPFLLNTLLCLIICLPAYMPIKYFNLDEPFSYFLIWLGVSIGKQKKLPLSSFFCKPVLLISNFLCIFFPISS
jgi:hypothetical protein